MADETRIPTIFLSYSWANKAEADAIDDDFKRVGIMLKRDVHDAPYRTNIKKFMEQIGKQDFAALLISDEFLHSENCIHEVTELLGTHGFEERVLPVLIGNAGGMFDPQKRAEIKDFWKDKLRQKQTLLAAHTDEDFLEEVRKVGNIVHCLGDFFSKIKYLNAKTLDELKKENYQSLLKVVGIDRDHVLSRVIEIAGMEDEEEQELALDKLHVIHPDNHFIWLQKSRLAAR